MSIVEMCEKMLLSEVKMKFSEEQKVFIVCVYYATKSYKKSTGIIFSEIQLCFINSNNYCIWSGENPHEYRESTLHPKKQGCGAVCPGKNCGSNFFSHQQLLDMCTRILFNSLCPSQRNLSAEVGCSKTTLVPMYL